MHTSSRFSDSMSLGSSIHETTWRHRMLQEERAAVVSPRAFDPLTPLRKPLLLKSYPGLAMSPEPPEVPPPGPISPVKLASSNGYSRSFAGLPWETGSMSIRTCAEEAAEEAEAEDEKKSEAPQWTPFRTTYAQSYASSSWDHTRVLNHERLRLGADTRPRSSRIVAVPATPSYQPAVPFERHPGLPFGGRR